MVTQVLGRGDGVRPPDPPRGQVEGAYPVFPYSQGDSPRCDSLDALGDVVRDEITAVVWNIQNEGAS